MDGVLDVQSLPLPPVVQKAYDAKQQVRASYYFEAAVAPRGAYTYDLSQRTRANNSAILRQFDELFPATGAAAAPRSPYLFSVFLDTAKIAAEKSLIFSIDLAVSTTGYEIDGGLWAKSHIPAEYLFRNTLVLKATPGAALEDWVVTYVWSDDKWAPAAGRRAELKDSSFEVPVESAKGFKATLRLRPAHWQ